MPLRRMIFGEKGVVTRSRDESNVQDVRGCDITYICHLSIITLDRRPELMLNECFRQEQYHPRILS
jgi:hypothetical protein